MKVLNVELVTSAGSGGPRTGIVRDDLMQFAFVGRSNVGKSSLLNALARRTIARTSAAAGKTRLATTFRVTAETGVGGPGRWMCYFVDLPGYGYARGGQSSAEELAGVVEAYFAGVPRRTPAAGEPVVGADGWPGAIFLLMDARHPGLASDVQAYEWITTVAAPPHLLATKVDKLSRAERAASLRSFETRFGAPALPVSSTTGEGLDEIWNVIARIARGVPSGGARKASL